jgi:hypothetical protein
MNKKNIAGMEQLEWKRLAGLSETHSIPLHESAAWAGSRQALDDIPDNEPDADADTEMPKVKMPGAVRLNRIKAAAARISHMNSVKSAANAEKAAKKANVDNEISLHRKTFVKEDFDAMTAWSLFLEDRGTNLEEFGQLINIAMESGDEEMAIELLTIEDQMDEIFGAIGGAIAKGAGALARGAGAVGGALAKGVGAVARTAGNVAGQAVGGAVSGVKAGIGAPAAAASSSANINNGTPAAPAATPAPAAAAAASTPAEPAQKKPGLLSRIAGGVAKAAGGLVGGAIGGAVKGVRQGFTAQNASFDYGDDFENHINEEYGLSAAEYVECYEHAILVNDVEMIEHINSIEEGIFDILRGGAKKKAEVQARQADTLQKWKAARAVVDKYGTDATRTATNRGMQVGVKAKPISGTSLAVPKARTEAMEEFMAHQLRCSGYDDDYINGKLKN